MVVVERRWSELVPSDRQLKTHLIDFRDLAPLLGVDNQLPVDSSVRSARSSHHFLLSAPRPSYRQLAITEILTLCFTRAVSASHLQQTIAPQ